MATRTEFQNLSYHFDSSPTPPPLLLPTPPGPSRYSSSVPSNFPDRPRRIVPARPRGSVVETIDFLNLAATPSPPLSAEMGSALVLPQLPADNATRDGPEVRGEKR